MTLDNVQFDVRWAFGNLTLSCKVEELPRDFWIEAIRYLETKGLDLTTDQYFALESWLDDE